jgi:hypothetical protein
MEVGIAIHQAVGSRAIEVYPYAGFRTLAGQTPPKKGTYAGTRDRVQLLIAAGVTGTNLAMWSHDGLDALVAARIALDHTCGTAQRISCDHDESAIWLPSSRSSNLAPAAG